MKLTNGIHHIAIGAAGLEQYNKTLSFYTDVLGMTIIRTWGSGENLGAMIDIGGGSCMEVFSSGKAPEGNPALLHLAFDVESTDACAKAVSEAGYQITRPPEDITINADNPISARIAFCIGPVGEIIEFFQTYK